jgi:hypothetical protein
MCLSPLSFVLLCPAMLTFVVQTAMDMGEDYKKECSCVDVDRFVAMHGDMLIHPWL